jgi:hypothetical protein
LAIGNGIGARGAVWITRAIIEAAVVIDAIAIIALFIAFSALSQIDTHKSIAAGRGLAGVETGIIGDAVAIITDFTMIDTTIATDLNATAV